MASVDLDLTTFVTRKGATGILLQGFKFRKDHQTSVSINWRCCDPKCKARCKTDIEMKQITSQPSEHNHPKCDSRELDLNDVRSACKRKAVDQPTDRASKIICTETKRFQNITIKDMHSIANSIYRERAKLMPKLPKERADIFIVLETYLPEESKLSVLVNDPDTQIIMISCEENLTHLQSCSEAYADGTFKYAPKFFLQLYTIHAYKNGQYAPCVFFLLPDKKEKTYEDMFRHLINIYRERNLDLQFDAIHVDLESSVHVAIRAVFQDTQIKACCFHLTQAWYRQIQKVGLTADYKDKDSETGRWLKMFFALPALQAHEVENCFTEVLIAQAPTEEAAEKFADYILDNYITANSKFPPHIWANAGMGGSTTNACESFHRYFGDHFTRHSPNIFLFLEGLNAEQERTRLKIRSHSNPIKRKDQRQKEDKRREIIGMLRGGEITMEEFVKQMGFLMLPVIM